ncbi:MAG: bifunctional DNA primase/polymerase, partial [Geminicoccaceae bacterium]
MGGVVPPSNERINAWTSYAQLVGRIFPVATCKPPIKGSRPKLDARLPTADVIREVLHRYGAYGIWPRPGIVVVDVENIGALQQFRASCGTVRTVMISTPSGGYHLVFRDPHPTLRGQVRIFDDLDLVCPDGVPWYVLGPGSSRHDTAYEIIDGEEMLATGELPVAPGWLYALQAGRQTQRSAASLPPVGKPHDRRCLDEIAAAFPTTQKGKRHRRLLDLAVSLRAAGADRHDLIEHCGRAATSGCEPAYVEAREQQDLERVVDWTMGHVQVRARRHGDIL